MTIATKPVLATLLLVVFASSAYGQLKSESPVIVADLFDPGNRIVVVSASSFNEALADPSALAAPLERFLDACRPDHQLKGPPFPSTDPIGRLENCVDCLNAFRETRFITDRGDQVLLFVLFNAASIRPEQIRPYFEENPRNSELFATGKALAEILRAEISPLLSCVSFSYTLQRVRSSFKVTIPLPVPVGGPRTSGATAQPATSAVAGPLIVPGGTAVSTPTAAAGALAATAATEIHSSELILGPVERWFFSADFSFSKTSMKFADTPAPKAGELKSKDFFIGLNFALGDLLADRKAEIQRRKFWRELLVKVQATPSRQPWTAWGVGIGVRGYRIKTILWDMDVVHPYVTVDRQNADTQGRRWRAVAGFGFDPRSVNKAK
jgi:hypothetical protein